MPHHIPSSGDKHRLRRKALRVRLWNVFHARSYKKWAQRPPHRAADCESKSLEIL